jgi:hypothetical protein
MDGVSTYLALIFGTLLSSQGTDASFVLTLSGFPPGFSLRSCVSDSIRPFPVPISSVLSRFPLSRFPFRRLRLYQILSGLIPSQRGLSSRPLGRSDVSNPSGLSLRSQIEGRTPIELNSGTPNSSRLGDRSDGLSGRLRGGGATTEPLRLRGNPKNSTDPASDCQAPSVKIF